VHALEECAALGRQWTTAREYCARRVDIISIAISSREARLADLRGALADGDRSGIVIKVTEIKKIEGELFILNGGPSYVGCRRRWQGLVEGLDALAQGTFVPHGRMYLSYGESDEDDHEE